MTDTPPLLTHPAPGVARILFNRPGGANRIERGDLDRLDTDLSALEARGDVRVLILTGAGRHFSSGFDLRALAAGDGTAGDGTAGDGAPNQDAAGSRDADPSAEGQNAFAALVDRIEDTPLITLAALNGPAIGGASDIALACDLRLGTPSCAFMMPAARFGLPLYPGLLRRYATRLGLDEAKRLILTAGRIEAETLRARGLVAEIVPPEALEARALDLALAVAAHPHAPLSAMKRALNALGRDEETRARAARDLAQSYDWPAIRARLADKPSRREA